MNIRTRPRVHRPRHFGWPAVVQTPSGGPPFPQEEEGTRAAASVARMQCKSHVSRVYSSTPRLGVGTREKEADAPSLTAESGIQFRLK